jgi:hypothetical protein
VALLAVVVQGALLAAPWSVGPVSAEETVVEAESSACTGGYQNTWRSYNFASGMKIRDVAAGHPAVVCTVIVPEGSAGTVTVRGHSTPDATMTMSIDGGSGTSVPVTAGSLTYNTAMAVVVTTGALGAGTHTLTFTHASGSGWPMIDRLDVNWSAAATTTTTAPTTTTTPPAPVAARCHVNFDGSAMVAAPEVLTVYLACQVDPSVLPDVGSVTAIGLGYAPVGISPPEVMCVSVVMEDGGVCPGGLGGHGHVVTAEGSSLRMTYSFGPGTYAYEGWLDESGGDAVTWTESDTCFWFDDPDEGPKTCSILETNYDTTELPSMPPAFSGGDATEADQAGCLATLEMRGPDSTGLFQGGVDYRFQVRVYGSDVEWVQIESQNVDSSTTRVTPVRFQLTDLVAKWLEDEQDPVIVFRVKVAGVETCQPFLYTEGRWAPAEKSGRRSLAECMQSAGIGWNPTSWVPFVLKGLGCVLEWAFIPDTSIADELAGVYAELTGSFPIGPVSWAVGELVGTMEAFVDGTAQTSGDCGNMIQVTESGGTTVFEAPAFDNCADSPVAGMRLLVFWTTRLFLVVSVLGVTLTRLDGLMGGGS